MTNIFVDWNHIETTIYFIKQVSYKVLAVFKVCPTSFVQCDAHIHTTPSHTLYFIFRADNNNITVADLSSLDRPIPNPVRTFEEAFKHYRKCSSVQSPFHGSNWHMCITTFEYFYWILMVVRLGEISWILVMQSTDLLSAMIVNDYVFVL